MYCRYIIAFVLWHLLVPLNTWSQSENVWAFGFNAGLDFNTSIPVPITTAINGWGEANASVSGTDGTLLFYTEGSLVWDKNHSQMPNGSSLTPIPPCVTSSFPGQVNTSSAAQGAAIVPMPGRLSKYYIFSLTAYECGANEGRLYYSVVDMNLNRGLGDIMPNQKGILLDTGLTEKMIAVSGNNCNVWILVQTKKGDLNAYEISESGVSLKPVVSKFNRNSAAIIGNIIVSPDRKKIGLTNLDIDYIGVGGLLYDFDPNSGKVDNEIELCEMGRFAYGICFSGNSSKLYVNYGANSGAGAIYQYDLSSGTPEAMLRSQNFIDTMFRIGQIRLGPDQKIYCTGASFFNTFLGSINAPDLLGKACQFSAANIALAGGSATKLGLPNGIPVIQGSRGSQYVHHQDSAACFANFHLLRIDSLALNVEWDDGSAGTTRMVKESGTYWVQFRYAESKCLVRVDSYTVYFRNNTLPEIELRPSCVNEATGSAWLHIPSGNTTGYHYTWLNESGDTLSLTNRIDNTTAGKYQLHISTTDCDTILNFYIPRLHFQLSFNADSIVCQGARALFNNSSDTQYSRFTWDFGDQILSDLKSPYHSYPHPGTFNVRLIGSGNICTDTFYQSVVVDSSWAASFEMYPSTICTGENIRLNIKTDSNLVSMDWAFGDGSSMTCGWSGFIDHAYQEPGVFPIMLSAHFRACPTRYFEDSVRIVAPPIIDLGTDTFLCLNGAPLLLKNQHALTDRQYGYLWNTGDRTEQISVFHPGIYRLTINDLVSGCSSQESVVVAKDCYINIPNAFSPNGDGVNDYFFPRQFLSQKATKCRMTIFNRWGQLVFKTSKNKGRGWDGKFNGMEQPSGAYTYFIEIEFDNNYPETYSGNVTLLR